MLLSIILLLSTIQSAVSFTIPQRTFQRPQISATTSMAVSSTLIEPSQRDAKYGRNIAQYLVDLHDNKATFDFCGGMMFQLYLSKKLREYLVNVAKEGEEGEGKQPIIFDSSKPMMSNLEGYSKDATADNVKIFHGRELRKVPNAEGGMGFVLQLSLAEGNDPEGWTPEEIQTYDGWLSDSGRTWRTADRYESEGFDSFKSTYGSKAFGLNHRFYLHFDSSDRMWLSAEDGCEGTPSLAPQNMFSRLFR